MKTNSNSENPSINATDIEGPGGIHMTGGDLTPPQNAGEILDSSLSEREGEQKVQRRQLAGQIEQQTHSHNPSATDPTGMPDAVNGHEVEQNNTNSA